MTKINIEEWFSSPKRWEKEHECLNMENINEKPCTYEGSLEEWIKELTTFIFIYPKAVSYTHLTLPTNSRV